MQYKNVQGGYLGVAIQDLGAQLTGEMGTDLSSGVVVVDIDRNGPAQQAGIKVDDVIAEIDGTLIQSAAQLLGIIASHKPGDTLDVVVQQYGKRRNIEIHLQQAKDLQEVRS